MADALALLAYDSVASGLSALDALVKEAPVTVLEANLVEPGRFLILFAGGVAEAEASHRVATERHADALLAEILLPMVHPDLVAGLSGAEDRSPPDTLGVVEGTTVVHTLVAADRALKDATVRLAGIRVAVGLGGRAFFVVHGEQHDVEASVAAGAAVLEAAGTLHRTEVIARPHAEMVPWLLRTPPFKLGDQ
jgi:microcompartment protein CcmL/EutN